MLPTPSVSLAIKRAGRKHGADVTEVEPAAEHFLKESARIAGHRIARGGALFLHLLETCGRRYDLRARDQLVSIRVVGIGMRVHKRPYFFGDRHGGAHPIEHFARQLEIHERVDKQCFAAFDHETGIAVTPGAIRLKICVAAVAEIVQPLCVRPSLHRVVPPDRYGHLRFRGSFPKRPTVP